MKILVISDTHGHIERFSEVLALEGQPDAVIHCGDICGDEDRLMKLAGCPCYMVAGNMDFSWGLPKEELVEEEGVSIFVCHGHRLGVNFDTEMLKDEAISSGADIALYGHTHVPEIHEDDGLIIMNPGSLCFPRQEGRKKTYGTILLKKGEAPLCEIHEL